MTPPTENTVKRHHTPGIGRADFHPAEHRLGVHRLRDHLEHLGLGIAQVLGDVGHSVVVELGDLLLLLGDRLAGLGDIGIGVRDLAFQAERGALQLQDTRARNQAPLDQRRDVLGFRVNRRNLVGKGLHLRLRRRRSASPAD